MDSIGFRVSHGALTSISPPHVTMPHLSIPPTQNLYSSGHTNEPAATHGVAALGETASSSSSFGHSRWDGEPDLRQALVGEMKVVYGEGSDNNLDDVALTSGCNLVFLAVVTATADPGGEVILPVPW